MKLKVIQSVKNDYSILGLNFNQSFQTHSFNKQNLKSFFALGLAITSNCVYFFHLAKTIDEFILSIFTTTSIVVVTIVYAVLFWKMKPIHELCDAIETLINESELQIRIFAISKAEKSQKS